ncbi:hypothetical protein [Enterococcus gallinarum]|uniref:hypothetical protein n=1 Tax=Enterococcus gallinarum TaxID=1353 RepID=UPI0012E2134A|nr:hypothetical protein [Enterococcus gallinarum]MUO32846.1 hypothetical protein [Enterococcus gallinarum]
MAKKIYENIKKWKQFKTADDYYDVENQRLLPLIFSTNKFKDIYCSKEALISFVMSVIFTLFVSFVIKTSSENPTDRILDLLGIQIGTLLGLLGFLIGGAALLTGSISIDMMKVIDKHQKFHQLLALLVPFYLLGVMVGISFFISVFIYLVVLTNFPFNFFMIFIFSLFNFYFLFYSLISSIMLLGTCIRIFILRYKIENIEKRP